MPRIPTGRHRLACTTTYDDGHVKTWHCVQPGTAQDAHAQLAARWRAAGAAFQRDRVALLLRREYEITARGITVRYVDEITHQDL